MSTPATAELQALADRIEHIAQQVADDGWPTIIRLTRSFIAGAMSVAAERDALIVEAA